MKALTWIRRHGTPLHCDWCAAITFFAFVWTAFWWLAWLGWITEVFGMTGFWVALVLFPLDVFIPIVVGFAEGNWALCIGYLGIGPWWLVIKLRRRRPATCRGYDF